MSFLTVNWRPTSRQLRLFGLSVIVILGGVGALLLLHHKLPTAAYVCWTIAAVVGLLGLTGTRAALPGYWAFTAVGFILGNILSRLLLVLVYVLVVTSMGLIMKLIGRDRLRIKRREVRTHWLDVPAITGKDPYQRQS